MKKPTFKRLPGRGTTLVSYISLYKSEDCLLQSTSTLGFHNSYRRFFYGDIQCFLIRQTQLGLVLNTIVLSLCIAAGTAGSIVAFQPGESAWTVPCFALALVLFVALVVHLRNGAYCVCHVRTAVQTQRLRSLTRMRNVRRMLDEVEPLIEAAQGTLSADEIEQRLRHLEPAAPAGPRFPEPAAGVPPQNPAPTPPASPAEPPFHDAP